jgi:hypothetical protein
MRPSYRFLLPVLLLVALALPATASADTIQMTASAPSAAAGSTETFSVSGTDSKLGSYVAFGYPFTPAEPCPRLPNGEVFRGGLTAAPISPPSFTYQTSIVLSPGLTELACAYVVSENLPTAAAELRVTIGPAEPPHPGPAARAEEEYDQANTATEERATKTREERRNAPLLAEAKEQAEEESARVARIAAARATPLGHLIVKPVAHQGHSSHEPGDTTLAITAAPYAYVTVKFSRRGHVTEHFVWGETASGDVIIPWTCASPGGIYRYTVSAHTDTGRTFVRHGLFQPVSASRCHALKQREAEAQERNARRYTEEREGEARERRETLERFERNCRAEGGTPITLYTSEGTERACRNPNGGLLTVPH